MPCARPATWSTWDRSGTAEDVRTLRPQTVEQLSEASSTPVQVALDEPEHGWREADRAVDRASARFGAGSVRPASLLGDRGRAGRRPTAGRGRDLD